MNFGKLVNIATTIVPAKKDHKTDCTCAVCVLHRVNDKKP